MSKGNELDEELRQRIICFIDTMKRTEVKLQKTVEIAEKQAKNNMISVGFTPKWPLSRCYLGCFKGPFYFLGWL